MNVKNIFINIEMNCLLLKTSLWQLRIILWHSNVLPSHMILMSLNSFPWINILSNFWGNFSIFGGGFFLSSNSMASLNRTCFVIFDSPRKILSKLGWDLESATNSPFDRVHPFFQTHSPSMPPYWYLRLMVNFSSIKDSPWTTLTLKTFIW